MPLPLMETSPLIETDAAPASAAPGVAATERFAPGSVLADRYRIVAALGRGGMGEVYRADDLKLGNTVALKFLPRAFAENHRLLEYFRAEVRNGRQVSHPNVCRIYDIGEFDGLTFLTMEYIDGEDLASLLRRIGRLPADKALEITHQLCAGLAAAHDVGLVHRDLKPANIMLDGRGHARITDFGLAVALSDSAGRQESAGTPAYMAPEQRAGASATVKSDIYSLGLVLFEIFTGKQAFDEGNLAAWRTSTSSARIAAEQRRASGTSSVSSSSSADVDPAVKRAILRCLERDPAQRPATALEVSAMLPGGDPLAAAVAAGETPSPDVVAAAGQEIAISVQGAVLLLFAIIVMAVLLVPLARRGTFIGLAPSVSPREVLEARADTIAKQAGVAARAADSYGEFSAAISYAKWRSDRDPYWYKQLDSAVPDVYRFTYRTSPEWLFAFNSFDNPDLDDPPMTVPGMTATVLDGSGRLMLFREVPPASDRELPKSSQTDWAGLFQAGGWDFGNFKTSEPHDLPNLAFDSRSAWDGVVGGVPLHVEGASLRGKPVAFTVSGPWVGKNAGFGGSSIASQIAFDVLIFLVLPI
ncbi:MAG: serine/threonine-protein kinase, partial [Actinomycetota bacterium]